MMTQTRIPETWRITIGNINSFPCPEYNGIHKYKSDLLKKLVIEQEADIILISEHNKNIKITRHQHQPSEIMKKWWPNTIIRSSSLASSSTSIFEPGGTMVVTNSRATAHTCQAGEDSQQLGRWNYITVRGKHEHYTTIVSVYKPAKSKETYMRQVSHSAKRHKTLSNEVSTEDLWYMDLSTLITEKMLDGHKIIVAGDFNDDLNNMNSRTRKFMENLGMKELLIDTYGRRPPTHIRGSTTIDGVFATEGIHMIKGQYIPFEQSPSNQRTH
jgi:hypothetical protein